jgi:hypothetical protein
MAGPALGEGESGRGEGKKPQDQGGVPERGRDGCLKKQL